jgi:hypothetical protein
MGPVGGHAQAQRPPMDELEAHAPREARAVHKRRRGVILQRFVPPPSPSGVGQLVGGGGHGDYGHDDQEEDAIVAQLAAASKAEARARWRREEADVVR